MKRNMLLTLLLIPLFGSIALQAMSEEERAGHLANARSQMQERRQLLQLQATGTALTPDQQTKLDFLNYQANRHKENRLLAARDQRPLNAQEQASLASYQRQNAAYRQQRGIQQPVIQPLPLQPIVAEQPPARPEIAPGPQAIEAQPIEEIIVLEEEEPTATTAPSATQEVQPTEEATAIPTPPVLPESLQAQAGSSQASQDSLQEQIEQRIEQMQQRRADEAQSTEETTTGLQALVRQAQQEAPSTESIIPLQSEVRRQELAQESGSAQEDVPALQAVIRQAQQPVIPTPPKLPESLQATQASQGSLQQQIEQRIKQMQQRPTDEVQSTEEVKVLEEEPAATTTSPATEEALPTEEVKVLEEEEPTATTTPSDKQEALPTEEVIVLEEEEPTATTTPSATQEAQNLPQEQAAVETANQKIREIITEIEQLEQQQIPNNTLEYADLENLVTQTAQTIKNTQELIANDPVRELILGRLLGMTSGKLRTIISTLLTPEAQTQALQAVSKILPEFNPPAENTRGFMANLYSGIAGLFGRRN